MKNKKTTIAGYATLIASILVVAATLLSGGDPAIAIGGVVAALQGAGLIAATDGGH